MTPAGRQLAVYLRLGQASQTRRQPLVRDKLLVLAGAVAAELGLPDIGAICRERILAHNPRHLIRRWPTFEDALGDKRFLTYLKQLRRRYAPERAEHLLHSLGIEFGNERQLYESEQEYALALLDAGPGRAPAPSPEPSQAPSASVTGAGRWIVLLGLVLVVMIGAAWALLFRGK